MEEAQAGGEAFRGALIARSAADARDVMIEGPSGVMAASPPGFEPRYEPSKRRVSWPNGATATAFSSDAADALRGPEFTFAWCDELAAFEDLRTVWLNLQLALRLGDHPRWVASTTPRPLTLIRDLLADTKVCVTRASTWSNAINLPEAFLADLRTRFAGTTAGRQEIEGELLGELDGALFTRQLIASMLVERAPQLQRTAVFVDPSVSAGDSADATGILAMGQDHAGSLFVLADRSGRMSPDAWARRAIALYWETRSTVMTCEANQGGELLADSIRQRDPRVHVTTRAVRGSKAERLMPAVALAEQGRLRLLPGLDALQDEATTWTPDAGWSPGRLDALSLGVGELSRNNVTAVSVGYAAHGRESPILGHSGGSVRFRFRDG